MRTSTSAIVREVADKAKPATKVLRLPRDMAPLINREASKQGVSENSYMLAVLAAAVGYKLSKRE